MSFWFSLLWGYCSSSLGLRAYKILLVPSKTGVSVSSCPLEVLLSNPAGPQSQIPSPFVRFPGWEAWHGVQNLHNSVRTSLVLLFSCLQVTNSASMGFNFIVIVPLLTSQSGFFFVFGCGISFFGGFQYWLVNGCTATNCNFGALTEGDECPSFYSAILNQKLPNFILFFYCSLLLYRNSWFMYIDLVFWKLTELIF